MLFEAALIGAGARLGKGILLTGAKQMGKIPSFLASGALKTSQAGWAGTRALKKSYPKAYGLAGGLATGFALSPIMAGVGDMMQTATIAYYGDTAQTAKANTAINFLTRGVSPYIAGGLMFNAAPIARRLANNPVRTRDWGISMITQARSMWDTSQRSRTFSASTRPISFASAGGPGLLRSYAQSYSKSLKSGILGMRVKGARSIIDHPFITASLIGGAAGAASGSMVARRPYGADIRQPMMAPFSAIQSSPTGGISPALQMSTYGLPMRIHNRSSNRRIR